MPTSPTGEAEALYQHRFRWCLELGLNEVQAQAVASATEIDMHEFDPLIRAGCSVELAFEICS